MSKKLVALSAMVGLLLTTSCSTDEIFEASSASKEAMVSFAIPSPDGSMDSRAFGDGRNVDKLYWAVYDADGTLLSNISKDISGTDVFDETINGKRGETVNIRLVKGQAYTVAFWAQNSRTTAYTITDNDLKNIAVDYSGNANDETRDAFFGIQEIAKVTTDATYDVTLKRPFAQINVGVDKTEWDDAVNAGVTVKNSAVKFTGIANQFNVLTGAASATTPSTVEYDLSAIPSDLTTPETLKVNVEGTETSMHKYLTMAYILAGQNKATTDATLKFKGENNEEIEVKIPALPYQRNYRTNIIGKVLTSSSDFKIIVDNKFDDDHNVNVNEVENIAGLQAAVSGLSGVVEIAYNVETLEGSNNQLNVPANVTDGTMAYNFMDVAADAELTINAQIYTGEISITTPDNMPIEGLTVNAPNATLVVNGNVVNLTATTGDHTLVIAEGVTVENLTVNKGNVEVYGTVSTITRGTSNTASIILTVGANASVPANLGAEFIVLKEVNGELTLQGDAALNTTWVVSKDATINLNGKTMTSTTDAIKIAGNGHKVTIKNGSISVSGARCSAIWVDADAHNSTITLKGITTIETGEAATDDIASIYKNGKAQNLNLSMTNCNIGGFVYISDNMTSATKNVVVVSGGSITTSTNNCLEVVNTNLSVENCTLTNNASVQSVTIPGTNTGNDFPTVVGYCIATYGSSSYRAVGSITLKGNTYSIADADGDYIYNQGNGAELYTEGDYFKSGEKSYIIANANGLKWLATEVNSGNTFAGYTMTLADDIDLNGDAWAPIGTSTYPFAGNFDGNGKTIKNISIDNGDNNNAGFFGYVQGTKTSKIEIKNVVIENVEVKGGWRIGGLVGNCDNYTTIDNINVKGLVKIEGYNGIGAVVGANCKTIKNITVNVEDGSYVKSVTGTVGGVVGQLTENYHADNITSNIDVIATKMLAKSEDGWSLNQGAGGVFGCANGYGTKLTNCKSSGNVTILDAETEALAQKIGGIAGGKHGGKLNLTNCLYTGTLSSTFGEIAVTTFNNKSLVGGADEPKNIIIK